MRQLAGRTAVITGAGSGIGRATALELARRGCGIAAVDISGDRARSTAAAVRALGPTATAHTVDVSDWDAMAALPAEVLAAHGACHVVVNNAGVTSAGSFEEESIDDLRWIIGINVWGVVHGCRAFLPLLRTEEEAHIVNLSSMLALLGLPHNASYSLTKGAIRSFTESLRSELVTSRIGVTAVLPGAIRTDITNRARGSQAAQVAALGASRMAPILMRPPELAARRIVRAIERNQARVLIGPDARAIDVLARLVPGRSGVLGRLTSRAGEEPSQGPG